MRTLALLLVAASVPGGRAPAAQSAPDAGASVRAFVEQYQRDAPSLVAHEEYIQNLTDSGIASNFSVRPQQQVTTAELVMVRLPGSAGWVAFRDVLTVNKRSIQDREERLLKLLQSPAADALAQAQKIARESARFNLGRITRTINVPDMALEYLHPRNANRVKFEAPRDERVDGRTIVVLKFAELSGPSIVRDMRGADLLGRGRVWIEPDSGALVRTELLLQDRVSNGRSTVDFGVDARLGIRVPVKMTERYSGTGQTIDAVATYSNFRSFAVATSEKVTKPPAR